MPIATSLTIYCPYAKVVKGSTVDISGWLKRLDTGAGLGYKRLRLWRKRPSDPSLLFWYEVGNYGNGFYVFSYILLDQEGIYQFQTEFVGDAEFNPCKSPILSIECYVPSAPTAVPTSTSIKASPSKVLTPSEVTLSGKLSRTDIGAGIPNKTVEVYRKRPVEASFVLHGRPSTAGDGSYSMSSVCEETGTYEFKAKFLGDAQFQASESSVVTVIAEAPKSTMLPIEFAIIPKYVGDIADIHGTLTGNGQALASKPVYCYIRKNGGTWIQDDKLLTLSDGSIIWVTSALELGSYEFQMKFQGDAYYKPCESNILTAKVEEKVTPPPTPPPTIPEGATHALRCNYYNLFGKSHEEIQAGVHNVVVPLIATWTTLAGWTYLGEEVYDKDNYFEIYFKPTGDPVTLPLKAILATICVAIIGIVIYWCAFVYLETKKMEYEERRSIEELYREGLISEETYRSLMEKYAPKDTWTWIMNMLPYLLLFLIIASIAGALPRGRRED